MNNKFQRLASGRVCAVFPSGGLPEPAAKLGQSYASTTSLIDQTMAKAEEVKNDKRYSDLGRREAMKEWFESEALPVLKQARTSMSVADQDLAKLRTSMTTSSIDRTDIAGALLRREAREWLKALDPTKRVALLSGVEPMNPLLTQAVVEAPPEFSGVSHTQHAALQLQAMSLAHPDEAHAVNVTEEALAAVAGAEQIASQMIREALGLSAVELDQALGVPSKLDRVREQLAEDTN